MLRDLQNLHVSQFETDDVKADPELFGFQSPALELKFERGTNLLLLLQFGKGPTNEPARIYARRSGQAAIVSVPRESLGAWRGEPSEFRDPRMVSLTSMPDLIEVHDGLEDFTVRRQTNGQWLVTEPYNFPADTNLMRAFIQRLANLKVVPGHNGDFAVKDAVTPEEFPKYGLAPPALKYIFKKQRHECKCRDNQPGRLLNWTSEKPLRKTKCMRAGAICLRKAPSMRSRSVKFKVCPLPAGNCANGASGTFRVKMSAR